MASTIADLNDEIEFLREERRINQKIRELKRKRAEVVAMGSVEEGSGDTVTSKAETDPSASTTSTRRPIIDLVTPEPEQPDVNEADTDFTANNTDLPSATLFMEQSYDEDDEDELQLEPSLSGKSIKIERRVS